MAASIVSEPLLCHYDTTGNFMKATERSAEMAHYEALLHRTGRCAAFQ